ncbi:MAG TPA: FtsX-like permease family protein [Caulobacteraceae bacterium]|nr:FtsX-like permease family protein [Caulobacteraceae bacterium]
MSDASPLLPAEDARDGALVFVVSALCFLACLAVVAALAASRAAGGWSAELRNSATVIVRPGAEESADAAAARAAEALAAVRGVGEVDALDRGKAEALLEPWLGKNGLPDDLTIPRLVAVDLDPHHPATAAELDRALKAANVDATVDDHTLWLKDILRAGLMAQAAAIGVAALIAAAAGAVIVFATRAGLKAREELVGVLHLCGAEDRYIAALFQARFARLAASAGAIGAVSAALGMAIVRLIGGGDGVTPALPVAWSDLLPLVLCPLAAGLIAAVAARATALSLLRRMT